MSVKKIFIIIIVLVLFIKIQKTLCCDLSFIKKIFKKINRVSSDLSEVSLKSDVLSPKSLDKLVYNKEILDGQDEEKNDVISNDDLVSGLQKESKNKVKDSFKFEISSDVKVKLLIKDCTNLLNEYLNINESGIFNLKVAKLNNSEVENSFFEASPLGKDNSFSCDNGSKNNDFSVSEVLESEVFKESDIFEESEDTIRMKLDDFVGAIAALKRIDFLISKISWLKSMKKNISDTCVQRYYKNNEPMPDKFKELLGRITLAKGIFKHYAYLAE